MILLADKIEKSFGSRVLFQGATIQINKGERYALVGPNGAGKTTMLKIIMGIDTLVGSSRSSRSGCRRKSLASAMRICQPPENSLQGLSNSSTGKPRPARIWRAFASSS